ncbi:MAG: hypothetical protein ABSH39_09825 [Candidatus Acidiferrum sp.]
MLELKGVLVSEKWHRPYAEALIETDPAESIRLIALAERAIITRYLELCICPGSEDEYQDLWQAVDALSELKEINTTSRALRNSAA